MIIKYSSRIPMLSLLLFGGLVLFSCKGEDAEEARTASESVEIRPEVVFTRATADPLEFYIQSRGVVEPKNRIQIIPRISGFVEQHKVREGRQVEEGELLVRLNDEEYQIEVQQAYNRYLEAKNEYTIEARLRGNNGDEGANDEMLRITTGLAEAELAWEKAKQNLSYTQIRVPFSGHISAKEVLSEGAYVSAGSALGVLIDASEVHVRFDLLESELLKVGEGMKACLTAPNGEIMEGRVLAVSPEVDPETKTGQVLVKVDNPGLQLKTGMTTEGQIFIRRVESKVRVPREALLERDGRTLVFKLSGEEVQWIYVSPVEMNTDWVLLNHEDIAPGDTIAVDQHFSISHQQRVIPLMEVKNE